MPPSFSSSSASAATSTVAPTDSTASGDADDSSRLSGSASLPFSLLISFVAVFLFFLGCGFGSRRVAVELRRSFGLLPPPSELQGRRPRAPRPILWDVYPRVVQQQEPRADTCEEKWHGMLPLAATYVREAPRPEPAPAPVPPRSAVAGLLEHFPILAAIQAIHEARRIAADLPPVPPHDLNAESAAPQIRAVQVAVIVAMPEPTRRLAAIVRARRRRATGWEGDRECGGACACVCRCARADKACASIEEKAPDGDGCALEPGPILGEYAIGLVQVPWECGEDVHDGS